MAATAEQVAVSPSPGAEVPAGELWRLVLRSWCGSTLAAVCERVGQFCGLDQHEIESTVLGLVGAGGLRLQLDASIANLAWTLAGTL